MEHLTGLDGVLVMAPQAGDGSPEIAWGDFFYHSPDGTVPPGQPFATILTKDYPEDTTSRLHRPGAYRVNLAVGADAFAAVLGHAPADTPSPVAEPADDVVLAHPGYARLAWVSVTNPGPRSSAALRDLVTTAHSLARGRSERRTGHDPDA